MAALVEPAPFFPPPELCDLRSVRATDLEALLAEESAFWRDVLAWDFSGSASLVRKFVDIHALSGYALVSAHQVVGYSYFVLEDHKGLIGDLYVMRQFRTEEHQRRLLNAVLADMMRAPYVHRIESQLMAFTAHIPANDRGLRIFPRDFLSLRLPPANPLPPRLLPSRVIVSPWQDHHQEAAAQLIASAYLGHVDSQINDQYRSVPGARKFLFNIVQYPGCGNFFPRASLAAYDRESGVLCAVCLASLVADDSGHITQICVGSEWQGQGLGYELLRQSLDLLHTSGIAQVSLTVTSSNRQALGLYESVGFHRTHQFAAYVWEGF
jgi:ribosomal protein S18 acetylase RimI-like enzyme